MTVVKAAYLTDLRTALAEVYAVANRAAPAWTPATITSRTTAITAAHIEELRAALLAV